MEDIFTDHIPDVLNSLYSVDEIDDGEETPDEDDEEFEEDSMYGSEKSEERGDYSRKFNVPVFRIDPDNYEGASGDNLYEYDIIFSEDVDTDLLQSEEKPKDIIYESTTLMAGIENEQMKSVNTKEYIEDKGQSMRSDVLSIEYEDPELINGQITYQRIVFEADIDGESVYELSRRKLEEAGIEVSSEYDREFDSMLFTSINRKQEGNEGNFNEFYLNGEIGDYAVDQQLLKAGDIIEWRYAEETDGSCGGVPDFNQIKSMLVYNTAFKNAGYALPGSNPLLLAA